MKLGAADFLEKPFSPEEVREVIRGVLTRDTITANSVTGYEEHIALAKRAINDRHPASAIEHARQAIAVDADRPDAFNLLGALLEVTGDRAGALKQYRIALELDPTHKGARENLERATSSSWRSSTPRRPGFE
jgi:tetratricopeptide (TPR) repeat protein